MRHLEYGVWIKETLEELRALQRRQSRSLAKRRLRFLIVLKSGECTSQAEAGRHIGIKERASEKLWKLYRTKGIATLLQRPRSGQPPKLDEQAKEALQRQLDSHGIQTLKQACDFVLRNNAIKVSWTAMHYYFQAMGIKKKTGRPTSVRKDVAGEKVFKKKSFHA
jgi:transposase